MGHDINVYRNWDTYPLLVLYIIVLIIGVLSLIHPIIRTCCKLKCLRKKYLSDGLMFKVAKVILKEIEMKKDQRETKYYLHKYEIPPFLVRVILTWLYQVAVITIALAITSFWIVFLIEETFACDNGLDCFPFSEDLYGDSLQKQPIENCSYYESATNITIVCYRFSFLYAQGFGAAGGVLVFATFSISAYKTVLFLVARLIYPSKQNSSEDDDEEDGYECCNGNCKYLGLIIYMLIILSPAVSASALIVVVLQNSFLSDTLLKTPSSSVQFLVYYVTWQYTGFVNIILGTTIFYITRKEYLQQGNVPILGYIQNPLQYT